MVNDKMSLTLLRELISKLEEKKRQLENEQCECAQRFVASLEEMVRENKAQLESLEHGSLEVPAIPHEPGGGIEPAVIRGRLYDAGDENNMPQQKHQRTESDPDYFTPSESGLVGQPQGKKLKVPIQPGLEERNQDREEMKWGFWNDAFSFVVNLAKVKRIEYSIETHHVRFMTERDARELGADGKPRGIVIQPFPLERTFRDFLSFCRDSGMEEFDDSETWNAMAFKQLAGPGDANQQLVE
ncbi:hypothetical protein BFJ63_vAg16661 [Fusarium oxysporum f. sp. narcissi]|uniref:Uncharacterized protein n=1 Tax=Fusarium oxysporum f. sp. narcissi TaxID=451672 RepID=A0A4Q2V671_FUSOX|nr:hypothetical protein BFJ63_vAg16661 [Fusarium oxysporum f. sp. narcissi]